MMLIRLLEYAGVALLLVLIVFQVLIPALRRTRIFPMFTKRPKDQTWVEDVGDTDVVSNKAQVVTAGEMPSWSARLRAKRKDCEPSEPSGENGND